MFSKIFSHERYISRCIYLAVEQEMKTFGEKEEKGKVRFLISLDISQSREVKHTTTDAGSGGGGRCTLRVVINLARHA